MDRVSGLRSYLKLPYQNISYDIIIYLIEDILDGNGNDYSDEEIEKIIKSFCYLKLRKYYTNIDVVVMYSKQLNKISDLKDVNGFIRDNTIYLKKENVLNFRNRKVDVLRTIFHEVQHIKQRYMIEHNEINYRVYLSVMEHIIAYKFGREYYKINYYNLFEELDARLEAEFELYDFLFIYNNDVLNNEIDEIINNVLKCEEESENIYRVINGISYEREELFDYIIQTNPEIVSECPILNFYYYEDGTKIPIGKIIKRRNEIPNNPRDNYFFNKIKKLDSYIIRNRQGSKINLQKDICSLLELEYRDEEIDTLISRLIKRSEDSKDPELYDIYNMLKNKVEEFNGKSKLVMVDTVTSIFSLIKERRF